MGSFSQLLSPYSTEIFFFLDYIQKWEFFTAYSKYVLSPVPSPLRLLTANDKIVIIY